MSRWIYLFLLVILVPLQTTSANSISLALVRPDLGLLLVYFIGFFKGEVAGFSTGLLAGILLDLFSAGPFGLQMASKALVGVSSGVLGRFFLIITAPLCMGLLFLVSLGSGLLLYLAHDLSLGGAHFLGVFRWTLLPESLYNAVLGGLLYGSGIIRLKSRTAEV
ncbi:MAG TPA: rod shape-determining protein MreD [Nitrospiria bacterium]